MSPKLRRNIEAKALPFTVMVMLVVVGLSTVFVLPPDNKIVSAATTDFDNWVALTIESDFVDTDLVDFPVLVYNSSCTILDGLTSNDFTFFDSDNSTECNWELERWDDATDTLIAWVNVTRVESDSDTIFYMYYDSDGDGGENSPDDTWNDGYELVLHMDGSDVAGTDDSTANNNDASSESGNPDYQQTGKIGYGINLEDGSAEYLNFGSSCSFLSDTTGTIEVWFNLDADSGAENTLLVGFSTTSFRHMITVSPTSLKPTVYYRNSADTSHYCKKNLDSGISVDTWYHLAYTQSATGTYATNPMIWLNGEKPAQSYLTVIPPNDPHGFYGNITGETFYLGTDGANNEWDGLIDELRISNIARNDSWLKASYNSTYTPTTFVTWDTPGYAGSESCYWTYYGLDANDRVTFGSGEASDTLYSNATGNWGAGAMLIINVSVNDSVTVEDICINLNNTDLHSSVHWENISIDVALDNATFPNDWYSLGVDEGDYNISLNASWDTDWGSNPFPISNSSLYPTMDEQIYVRFKLELPSDATVGTHTTDEWIILWKAVE